MDAYQTALKAYLETEGQTQEALAEKVGCTQAAINRYVKKGRLPKARIAREIHAATGGKVPFKVWQQVATERLLRDDAKAAA